MGFSGILSSNLATKFRNSKWRPQNWPVFEKIRRRFNSKYKNTLYTFMGFSGLLRPNLATKFQNSKWRPQNWPIFKKIRRILKIKVYCFYIRLKIMSKNAYTDG